MPSVIYDQQAIAELSDRANYEAWLLEGVYKLVNDELFPNFPDDVIYPLGNLPPVFFGYMQGTIVLNDWRPGFLAAGTPLVFISAFKFLDMFLEWVLERNDCKSRQTFSEKIKKLKGQIAYPPAIQLRPWLRDRLLSLYEVLTPLRGTIIHSRHFESTNGELRVSISKGVAVGLEFQISAQALRTFAVVCVSTLRYVEETWPLDLHRENLLRWQLDQLTDLHLMPTLGQKEPCRKTVRVFLEGTDPSAVDVKGIRRSLDTQYPDHSIVFDLRVLLVQTERVIAAYLFPWAVLDDVEKLADASPYLVALPEDLDRKHYALSGVI